MPAFLRRSLVICTPSHICLSIVLYPCYVCISQVLYDGLLPRPIASPFPRMDGRIPSEKLRRAVQREIGGYPKAPSKNLRELRFTCAGRPCCRTTAIEACESALPMLLQDVPPHCSGRTQSYFPYSGFPDSLSDRPKRRPPVPIISASEYVFPVARLCLRNVRWPDPVHHEKMTYNPHRHSFLFVLQQPHLRLRLSNIQND